MSDLVTRYLVDGALCVLAAFSTLTWILILYKTYTYGRLALESRRFTARISATPREPALALAAHGNDATGPKARLARVALNALSHAAAADSDLHPAVAAWDCREVLERQLSRQIQRERRALEQGLTVLASIANVAPFVGLFGTVFGIIHALRAMASAGSSGVEAVAGPIGQALVATGVGIAVAIPAVLAYNLFLRRLNATVADLDDYAIDLLTLAQHSGFRVDRPANAVADKTSRQRRSQEACA